MRTKIITTNIAPDATRKMADCEKEEAHNLVSYLHLLNVYLIN